MKKLLLLSLCFLFYTSQILAQNRTVTGTVIDKEDGGPLPGVGVKVKGTSFGVVTGANGKYSISVPTSATTLVFSFIGYETIERPINGAVVNISLSPSSKVLGEVQITGALGISHTEKELGYATAKLSAKEVTETNVTNVANGLTGKIAGLAVYSLNDQIDPTVSVVLRGNRSLSGNNTALIVLDGVPLPGGLLSSINPEDVADVTILKGANAAALYGSEGSNGALVITTKRGSADGKPTVTYSNSLQLKPVAYYPKLQNNFGPYGGESIGSGYVNPVTLETYYVPYENQLYGPAYGSNAAAIGPAYNATNGKVQVGAPAGSATGPINYQTYSPLAVNPVHAFFNTGVVEQNNISFAQGDAKNNFRFSFGDDHTLGSTPSDVNDKLAFSLSGTKTYGIFSMDYSIGYTRTNISTYGNAYTAALFGFQSIYAQVLQFPAFLNIKDYQDSNSTFGNPNDFYNAYAINPYWIINNTRNTTQRDAILSQATFKLSPTDWFDASYRVSDNFGISQNHNYNAQVDFSKYGISDFFQAGNVPSNFPTGKAAGGVSDSYGFGDGSGGYSRIEGDAALNFHHTFMKDYKFSLLLGNSVWQQYQKAQNTNSNTLLLPGYYNINAITGLVNASEGEAYIRQFAFYGALDFNYKGWLNLEGTLRNDHDSRLAASNRSFYYPSGSVSFIATEAIPALRNNKVLNFAKLSASIAQVGQITVGPYSIYNVYNVTPGFPYGALGALSAGTTNYSLLKPELTTAQEYSIELGLFDNRINFTATYYDEHDKNQTQSIGTSITTGYSSNVTNIGETRSYGQEYQFTADVLTQSKNKVGVRVGVNLSRNESNVLSINPNDPTTQSINLGNGQYAVIGQPFPLLEGTDFVRDPANGKMVVDAKTGYPSTAAGALTQYGRTTPEYNMGLSASINYKFISLEGVAEFRTGYVIFNGVGQTLNFAGASAVSASAGRQPFVFPNSEILVNGVYTANTNVNVQNGNYGLWQSTAYNTNNRPYISSGAFWKLREVNLTFNLNQFIKQAKYIKGLSVSFTGRNLLMFTPDSNPWTDPEFSNVSATSTLRGVNNDSQTPGTRVFGGQIKLTF